jgi:hypothetical protein
MLLSTLLDLTPLFCVAGNQAGHGARPGPEQQELQVRMRQRGGAANALHQSARVTRAVLHSSLLAAAASPR